MLLWLFLAIPVLVAMFLYYLWWLPTDLAAARRKLQGRNLYARFILEQLRTDEHAAMAGNRDYCRRLALRLLPRLLAELKEQTTGFLAPSIGLVYVVYLLTWLKAKLLPGRDDLMGLIGVQLLLLRSASR